MHTHLHTSPLALDKMKYQILNTFVGVNPPVKSILEMDQTPKVCEKKEEKKMFNETQFNLDEKRIDYLSRQLDSAFWQKDLELEEKFGMREVRPSSIEEGIEWIKAGKFSLKEDEGYGGFWSRLLWQQVPKDKKGWEKAAEALRLAQQTVEDTITLKSSDEGLKALNDFRAWKYAG